MGLCQSPLMNKNSGVSKTTYYINFLPICLRHNYLSTSNRTKVLKFNTRLKTHAHLKARQREFFTESLICQIIAFKMLYYITIWQYNLEHKGLTE